MNPSPTPWRVGGRIGGCVEVLSRAGLTVALVPEIGATPETDPVQEGMANAVLIAAVPELLEALKAFESARGLSPECGRGDAFKRAWKLSFAAINKAGGRS